jgi:Zn-dependent protease with chaperone function
MARLLGATFFVFMTILALFFGVGLLVIMRSHLPMQWAMPAAAGFALLVVLIQFAMGPMIIDWIVKIRWANPHELGSEFDTWLRQTCGTFKIPTPRFGIIEEAAPNAFTYGHGAYDARVVVSRGLIEALSPEELRAVVAHELGHIKHRDFVVMTAIQALVLAMYALYMVSRRTQRGGWYVIILSYIAYWVSYYASLYLSRIREYMADYAAAQITGRPNDLATALVKIAYGLAQTGTTSSATYQAPSPANYPSPPPSRRGPVPTSATVRRGSNVAGIRLDDPSTWPSATPAAASAPPAFMPPVMQPASAHAAPPAEEKDKDKPFSARALGAFGVMGIGSVRGAVAWTGPSGLASPDNFVQAARWEIYNPWAKIAEVCSTHPLTALRIKALQKLNPLFGQPDAYDFSKIKPAKYKGFFGDLMMYLLPTLFGIVGIVTAVLLKTAHPEMKVGVVGFLLFLTGLLIGNLVQLLVKYPSEFLPSQILRMLGEVDVSPIRCKPVALEGTFTGRLDAGVAWSSDYIFQDQSGFISCLYRQPLGILKLGFGLFFAQNYVGRPVRVFGWYRRFNAPYVEIAHVQMMDTGEILRPRTVAITAGLNVLGLVLLSGLLYVILK